MTTQQPVIAKHASTGGGHYYTEAGEQIAMVPKASEPGAFRPPTLADARKNDWGPGVTTITGCADKPQLTIWKQKQAILSALTLPRRTDEPEAEWLDRVLKDAGETARKAAEQGTAIHAAAQQSFQGQEFDPVYAAHVQGIRQCLLEIAPNAKWVAEKGCASPYGFGTKADLSSDEWVWDFKGKEFTTQDVMEGNVKLYDEHPMQLAATRQALGNKSLRCGILFVSRSVPGLVHPVEATKDELDRGLGMFLALLFYWQIKNRYRPSWARPVARLEA